MQGCHILNGPNSPAVACDSEKSYYVKLHVRRAVSHQLELLLDRGHRLLDLRARLLDEKVLALKKKNRLFELVR